MKIPPHKDGSDTAVNALLMDGRDLAKEGKASLKESVSEFIEKYQVTPGLAVVLVGNDQASIGYSKALIKNATELGILAKHVILPAGITYQEYNEKIAELNQDPTIHGISLQWPLPHPFTLETASMALAPEKDVEGYHPLNTGRLFGGMDTFVPATPLGGLRLLKHYGFSVTNKICLVVGCGVTVGKPLIAILLHEKTTVLVAHSPTTHDFLRKMALESDFIFSAAGQGHLITGDMIKPGAVVIDFGMSFKDGKMYGDVEVESVSQVAQAVTTTPNVTGRQTSIALLENVLKAARAQTVKK